MGGADAKNRRKLQRQQQQQQQQGGDNNNSIHSSADQQLLKRKIASFGRGIGQHNNNPHRGKGQDGGNNNRNRMNRDSMMFKNKTGKRDDSTSSTANKHTLKRHPSSAVHKTKTAYTKNDIKNNDKNDKSKSSSTTTKKKEKKFQKPKHLKRKLLSAEEEEMKTKLQQEIQAFEQKKLTATTVLERTPVPVPAPPAKRQKMSPNVPVTSPPFLAEMKDTERDFSRSTTKITVDVSSQAKEEPVAVSSGPKICDDAKNAETLPPTSKSSSFSDTKNISDSDSDSDSEREEHEEGTTRERGRRRRGRKSTSAQVQEETLQQQQDRQKEKEKLLHEQNKNKKDRYCVGRKPVSDFKIGTHYQGKVIYVKPFGLFLDINCHSDAFCHVSRCSDDYVANPQDLFQEGQVVDQVRVVEIDRKNKRITVSLQSEARMADEQASIDARKQRKQKQQQRNGKKGTTTSTPSSSSGGGNQGASSSLSKGLAKNDHRDVNHRPHDPVASSLMNLETVPEKETPDVSLNEVLPVNNNHNNKKPESEMTPAELKRARKIARRAARRTVQEQNDDDDGGGGGGRDE